MSSVRKTDLSVLLYLLILLFLPTQFGKHFWPSFSYVSGIRVDYLSPTIYTTDVLILALFTSVFIKSFRNGLLKKLLLDKKKLLLLLLLSGFLAVNIINSFNIPLALYGAIKLAEFVFFGFITKQMFGKIKMNVFMIILSLGIILESIIAIFQFIKQGSLGGVFYYLGERAFSGSTPGIANVSIDGNLILRAYGTFSHPNVLSGFLLLFMIFIIFNLDLKKRISSIFLTAVILGTTGLLLTFSRLPILLWILSILIFVIAKLKIEFWKRFAFAALIMGSMVLSVLLYSPFFIRFIQSSVLDESILLRNALLEDAVFKFTQSPLLGFGLNNYLHSPVQFKNIFILQPVHNIFMLILVQAGIIGITLFVWGIYKTYVSIAKKKKIYLKVLFCCLIILGLFDHYFLTIQQGQLMLAFFAGLFWSNNEKRD